MFRLIAIALVSTYSLLVLMGTAPESPMVAQPMALIGAPQRGTTGPAGDAVAERTHMAAGMASLGDALRSDGRSYVTGSTARLRERPSPDAAVLTDLASGARVTLLSDGPALSDGSAGPDDFVRVRGPDGKVGYVDASLLHPA